MTYELPDRRLDENRFREIQPELDVSAEYVLLGAHASWKGKVEYEHRVKTVAAGYRLSWGVARSRQFPAFERERKISYETVTARDLQEL